MMEGAINKNDHLPLNQEANKPLWKLEIDSELFH